MDSYNYLNFYGALHECPYKKKLQDCPIKPVDDLPFGEKFLWFEKLPKEEKDAMVEHHYKCSAKRA